LKQGDLVSGGKNLVYTVYMNAPLAYPSVREARDNFKSLLDAADQARPAIISRNRQRVALVDADRLVYTLMATNRTRVQAVAENDGWSLFMPGLPIAADGNDLDSAIAEFIEALRDYAEAWIERLRFAPNHAMNWDLVQMITLATDAQLRDWLAQ
jgi:hypothetical protein